MGCTIPCICLFLVVTLATGGVAEAGLGARLSGPKDCGDVYLGGRIIEGYYAIFPNMNNTHETVLIYCNVEDGMQPRNSSIPRSNPKNCQDLYDSGDTESGVKIIYPYSSHSDTPVIVLCEQDVSSGGWTVFQKRDDYGSQVDFYRSYADYAFGFGNTASEYWLGNDIIHELTKPKVSELYVELTSFAGVTKHAHYEIFDVRDGHYTYPYQLTISHYVGGSAGDCLSYHNGMQFSTYDNDLDTDAGNNCASEYKGGWWYYDCYNSNLNGVYYDDGRDDRTSANWHSFDSNYESLKTIRMMTRPLQQNKEQDQPQEQPRLSVIPDIESPINNIED